MKSNGAPETGDLVVVKPGLPSSIILSNNPGIIINCRGIHCEVRWSPIDQFMPAWFARSDLTVVGDINESR